MIPIRDNIDSKNHPVVNWLLIIVNSVVFIIETAQGDAIGQFFFTYGLVPARYSVPSFSHLFSAGQQAFSLVSFMFLHGGFFHLLGNMWFLYIFGDNVEDRLGHVRYLVFYLVCGWVSGLTHLYFNLYSQAPTIGASGAIAGVMGAYFILYPRSRIITLIPILFIPLFVELPAAIFLGIWLLFQFLSVTVSASSQAGGIAWWAHVGGFIFGALALKLFLLIPGQGFSRKLREHTLRKSSPRLHFSKATARDGGPADAGTISITAREAMAGTRKLVQISSGLRSRLVKVMIPPGIQDGELIRLKGVAGKSDTETASDLYLRVKIDPLEHDSVSG